HAAVLPEGAGDVPLPPAARRPARRRRSRGQPALAAAVCALRGEQHIHLGLPDDARRSAERRPPDDSRHGIRDRRRECRASAGEERRDPRARRSRASWSAEPERARRNIMVRINKVYTRTGDDGTTGLVGGARAGKDSPRIEAYGTVDELNAAVGL